MKKNYTINMRLSLFLSFFILLFGKVITAQVSAYSFLQTTEVYVPVTGTVSTATGDDGTQTAIPIGFTFTFGGAPYTTFSITTNGMIRLGGAAINNGWVNNLNNSAVLSPLIAPLWDDNHRNTGSIQFVVSGVAPNRTLEVGWDNVNLGGTGTTSATFTASFKIRLYETTNVIDMVYGGSLATAGALTASIGLNDLTSFLSVTPAVAATVSSATPNNAISSVTNLAGIKYVFTPPLPCAGAPTAGTASAPAGACSGVNFVLSLAGYTSGASGITFQWQSSPDGITYTNMAGATTANFTTSQTAATFYQCIVTCTASGLAAISNAINVLMSPATYATIPYLETFETSWINGCATKDIVSNSWRNNPVTGNNSWRRQDEGATAAWGSITSGIITPSGSSGAARFHSFSAPTGAIGTYDLYINLSTTSAVSLGFNYQNTNGLDKLEVLLSTDGGVTFGPVLGTYTTGAWAAQTINLGVVASATSVIRFKATSDFGGSDIGIDNVKVDLTPSCTAPNALTIIPTSSTAATVSWNCIACTGSFIVEYGPAGFTPGATTSPGAGGTIASLTATSPFNLTGLPSTSVSDVYVRQDCGSSDYSLNANVAKFIPGDVCENVIDLATLTSPFNGTTTGANHNFTNTCAAGNICPDLIYSIQVPNLYTLVIGQTANGYDSENTLFYGGACPGTTQIACFDDPDIQSRTWQNTTGSTQTVYWVQDGFSNTSSIHHGTFTLEWTLTPPNSTFTGLSSSYCIGESSAALTPATLGGVFSGTGISGSAFDPAIAGVGSYAVTYTLDGCYTSTQSVTVNALPTVTATSTGSAVCSGTSVTLTGAGATSYAWDNSVIDGTAFVPTGTTTYNVVGTDANGCTNTASVSVTVNTLPTVTATSTGSAVCSGTSVTLTGAGATSYAWDNSVVDGTAFVPTGTLSYNVVGTDVNGCTNTASVSVTVNALPTVTATSTGSAVCSGTSVTLTGGGATSYAWDNSVVDGTAFVPSGSLSYNVVGTDVNGCTNTASVSVTVNALPTVTATSTGSSVCSGTSVTLTGGGATAYAWDNSVVDGTAFVPSGTTTYNVVGTDVNGCTNTASVSVTVNTLPMIMASSTPVLCNGGTSSVTITGMDGTPSYTGEGTFTQSAGTTTYSITDANGCVASTNVTISEPALISSTQFLFVCAGEVVLVGSNSYSTTGIYTDVLSSAIGCDSTVTTDLTVDAALDLTTSVSGNVITATSTTATYQWIDCDNGNAIIASETGQSYTALSSGNFAVIITEVGSCSDTSACVNVSVTGIDSNFEQIVSIYPNPSNGLFTFSINNVVTNQIVISILDIQGKIVFTETDKNIATDYKKQINLSDLAKGIYYVKLNIGSEIKTQKLIIQ